MIENLSDLKLSTSEIAKFTKNGVVADTNVLLVLFISEYAKCSNKNYLYKNISISPEQVKCLDNIVSNLRISKLIITPNIFAEFINKIKKDLKCDSKILIKSASGELKKFIEINVKKNDLIDHQKFLDFGNDISLVFAAKEQIKNFKYASIISFDGRFLREFFNNEKNNNILAINLGTLKYFFI